jgi:hypothetical protein
MSRKKVVASSKPFNAICVGLGFLCFSAVSCVFAVLVATVAYHWFEDRLNISETTYTPDGKLKAVVFSLPHSHEKHVSVLSAKAAVEAARGGNVFSDSCRWLGARWKNNHSLVIYRDGDGTRSLGFEQFIAFDRGVQVDIQNLRRK